MKRKGQITLFIIIGIVVLIGILLIFFLNSRKIGETELQVPSEAKPLYNYVKLCLESTSLKGIQLAGMQGGYIDMPSPALESNYSAIAYYTYDGKNTAPSKEVIESQVSSYIERSINSCINDFSTFVNQGYNITAGDISVKTLLRETDVMITLTYPVTMVKKNARIELSEYIITSPVRLGYIYDISKLITARTITDPEWIDMTFLSDFDVKVDIIPHDAESFVYSISDSESMIDGAPYVFLFANHFIVNKAPVLDIPDKLFFNDGEAAIYKVKASDPENDQLTFSDDSALFDITEDGVILFTPEVPGEYDVAISAEDDHYNLVSKVVRFVVR